MLLNCPMAKVSKQHMVGVMNNRFESSLRILDMQSPFFEQWLCCFEFSQTHPSLMSRIDLLKGKPVFIVHSQIVQQKSKLSSVHVVVPVSPMAWQFGFGQHKRSHNHWLCMEQFGNAQHVTQSFIDFGQAEQSVAINVNQFPNLKPPCSVFGCLAIRQFMAKFLINFQVISFHIDNKQLLDCLY